MRAIFDTNIIIDYLNGEDRAAKELEMYNHKYISIITYVEVLVGISSHQNEKIVRDFLIGFNIVNIEVEIAELAIEVRKKYRIKIPDAIIFASAQKVGAVLVTRNTKDFLNTIPIVRVPYEL